MRGTGNAVMSFMIMCCLVSAVLGWVIIEFMIWVFTHVAINF